MKDFEEKACLCALNRIFGFEPKIALAIISHLGSASEVFRLSSKEIDSLTGPYSRYRGLIVPKAMEDSAIELERLSKEGISFCGWTEDTYPDLLRECADAPIGLYVRSGTPAETLWKPARRIAIVGTRDISPYGLEWCSKTVEGIADTKQKPLIVSGLALGTDICAHRKALDNGLPPIAVMPTGPDAVYPHRHLAFADDMCRRPGCALITDYPPRTAPLPVNFLRRNRIIAGLSHATVLIESKIKGGGMMTARLAFSYDRDVFALPGRVDDIRSQGCNKMISEKIAEPLVSIDGFIRSVGLDETAIHMQGGAPDVDLEIAFGDRLGKDAVREMAALLECIRRSRGATIEELGAMTGIEYGKASSLTGMLELEGFISIDLLQRCSILSGKKR